MPGRRTAIRRGLLVGAALAVVALGIAWSQRRPIATDMIARALAAKGVTARYTVREIGFRTQRLENVSIGVPARPDLVADWVEVDLVPSWSGVSVTAARAGTLDLRVKIAEGQVSLGAIDKLLPKSLGGETRLPNTTVAVGKGTIHMETPIGAFALSGSGGGNLSNGFRAVLMTAGEGGAPLRLASGDCAVETVAGQVALASEAGALRISTILDPGPSACGTTRPGAERIAVRAILAPGFDSWTGRVAVVGAGMKRDSTALSRTWLSGSFEGTSKGTKGSIAARGWFDQADMARGPFDLRGRFAQAGSDGSFEGRLTSDATVDSQRLNAATSFAQSADGTPLGPIARQFAASIGMAGRSLRLAMPVSAELKNGGTRVQIASLDAYSGGGATLRLSGDSGLIVDRAGASLAGLLNMGGGGLPQVEGRIVRATDGSTRGVLTVAPYLAGSTRLALSPVRFAAGPGGSLRVESEALLDGPLADGRVEGVRVPLVLQSDTSGLTLWRGCAPVGYRRITVGGTVLAPGGATLCPTRGASIVRMTGNAVSGGARTGPLRIAGRIGDQPASFGASSASFEIGGPLSLTDLAARIGGTDATVLRIDRIDGVARPTGFTGRYAGLSGNIAKVPFLASQGQGRWRFAKGALDVDGALRLADAAAAPRFNPLLADGVKLRLKDGAVSVDGIVREPVSNRALATVKIAHDLSKGAGDARFAVTGLNFGKSLQPEAITPLTKGLIADLYGQVDGSGVVRWTGDKVTSSGSFRTDGLDLAAAFGPVTGASGEIVFDDLIALSTPPGQQVKLALVNPGVEVKDGVIAYRLRPGQIVEVERGRWPFAGGTLGLDPATLDFGQTTPRRLSFRVSGMDAAKFIEELKLDNIAATGTFDGTLPIVFDATGGRIVGGSIVARAGGGTLAYVGDVSNAQTNMMTKLAFDALKSIRYGNLIIELDGSLDGEMISLVRFDGVNQSPVAPTGLAKSFTGLPFKFNIRVQAPFRGLVGTARSFQDPGLLLNRTVQPVASEPRP